MTDNFIETALTCIKELEPLFDIRPLQTCLKLNGHDISLDDTLSACEKLRDQLYVNFRKTTVAGPRKYNFASPLELRITGTLFLQGRDKT